MSPSVALGSVGTTTLVKRSGVTAGALRLPLQAILALLKVLTALRLWSGVSLRATVNWVSRELLHPLLDQSYIQDAFRLAIVGGTISIAHRSVIAVIQAIISAFTITANFGNHELPYFWIDHWLHLKQAEIESRTFSVYAFPYFDRGDYNPATTKHWSLPTSGHTFTFWWGGHRLRITRFAPDTIQVRTLAWSRKPIDALIRHAQESYYAGDSKNVMVYIHDYWGNWKRTVPRPTRSMASIILNPVVKDMLVDDARRYLASQSWYAARGIPWRRGMLFYGVPGSGKTSTVYALAGKLGLSIYCLSLRNQGLNDSNILDVLNLTPTRSIILLEDIDAMQQTREKKPADASAAGKAAATTTETSKDEKKQTEVTLSGLLNAIDGLAAPEGRLVICTTNYKEKLDPALKRAGRLDLWVEFGYATRWQASELFQVFYPYTTVRRLVQPDPPPPSGESPTADKVPDATSTSNAATTGPTITSPTQSPLKKTITLPPTADSGPVQHPPPPREEIYEMIYLANKFADSMPLNALSVADLQGYLMLYRDNPIQAAFGAEDWAEWYLSSRREKEGDEAGTEVDPVPPQGSVVAKEVGTSADSPQDENAKDDADTKVEGVTELKQDEVGAGPNAPTADGSKEKESDSASVDKDKDKKADEDKIDSKEDAADSELAPPSRNSTAPNSTLGDGETYSPPILSAPPPNLPKTVHPPVVDNPATETTQDVQETTASSS